MHHASPLIAVLVGGLGLAFFFGTLANRFKLPPLFGYLLAGVAIGPFTPGFIADVNLVQQLADIGIILLMFGVGLHFSLRDLISVKAIAVPGAVGQIAIATLMGMALGWALGWGVGAGLVFGLALSVASTVVLLRAMQERRLVETERGHIAVGWLIVEDIAMVLVLVILPALASSLKGAEFNLGTTAQAMGLTLGKLALFTAIMLVAGRRVVPWVLHYIAHTGSRELFRLAVLSVALGVALGAAVLFDVSIALGAFFAGMIMSESQLSQRAAEESLPLRDAFAVLFFVSVGMLFNPSILLTDWAAVLATVAIIVVGKSAAAYFIVRAFKHSRGTALTISASLAQIGEFSFILAGLGVTLGLLPERGRDLILAGAIISIMLNPLVFGLLDRILEKNGDTAADAPQAKPEHAREKLTPTTLSDHAVLVGYGRVGKMIADGMEGQKLLVIEEGEVGVPGIEHLRGNGARGDVLDAANLKQAKLLFVAIPQAFEAGRIIEQARKVNPLLLIVARAHFDAEITHLINMGADKVIMGEREIALAMLDFARTQ
jgi:CPA2 family monovalent cation:H+ antiporter-2